MRFLIAKKDLQGGDKRRCGWLKSAESGEEGSQLSNISRSAVARYRRFMLLSLPSFVRIKNEPGSSPNVFLSYSTKFSLIVTAREGFADLLLLRIAVLRTVNLHHSFEKTRLQSYTYARALQARLQWKGWRGAWPGVTTAAGCGLP